MALVALTLCGAASQPQSGFTAASLSTLPNGAIVAQQSASGVPLVGALVSLPAGLEMQPSDEAGVAALTAAVVVHTPVDGGRSVLDVAAELGASVSYKLDPRNTRYYVEGRAPDVVRLLRDLAAAIENPDGAQVESQRAALATVAAGVTKDPALTAFAMLRQIRYRGSGYALPDAGNRMSLARLGSAQMLAFASFSRRGKGSVIALTGAASSLVADAATQAFSRFPAGSGSPSTAVTVPTRPQQIVVHGDVATPWIALAYGAPAYDAADYPAMLVVQALLGGGRSKDALTFGSAQRLPDEYAGAFYQDDADPATFVLFVNGQSGAIDQALRQVEGGIGRLRTRKLDAGLIDRAKRLALGRYYTSATTLEGASGILDRCARSGAGKTCEDRLAARILAVKPADVRAVAERYFIAGTTALLLPPGNTQNP